MHQSLTLPVFLVGHCDIEKAATVDAEAGVSYLLDGCLAFEQLSQLVLQEIIVALNAPFVYRQIF